MKVRVTSRHMNEGEAGDPCGCPIALAVRDAFPSALSVNVGHETVSVGDEVYRLSYIATEFIHQFDEFQSACVPFEFDMEPMRAPQSGFARLGFLAALVAAAYIGAAAAAGAITLLGIERAHGVNATCTTDSECVDLCVRRGGSREVCNEMLLDAREVQS